jgi:uncharacterized membrane protein
MHQEREAQPSAISRTRLEFLFDGIFAIAMTILVLELKVPELADRRSAGELGHLLAHHAPTFASYLLSFLMLGIFWYRHNQQFRHFRLITNGMLACHFFQLAAAAFFPFSAALLGRYPANDLSHLVYIGCVLVYAWATLGNWTLAHRCDALAADLPAATYLLTRRRLARGCAVISLLFALALVKAMVA